MLSYVVVICRRDKTLQRLVYKMVPGLYRSKSACYFCMPDFARVFKSYFLEIAKPDGFLLGFWVSDFFWHFLGGF